MLSVSRVLPVCSPLLNECSYTFLRIIQPKIVNHHFTCFPETFPQSGFELLPVLMTCIPGKSRLLLLLLLLLGRIASPILRMQMQSIVTRPSSVVCRSVCHTTEPWHSAVSCAKWLNLSICPFGCELGWAEGSSGSIVFARWRQCALMERHIGATWRIRLNHPSAAAMRPYVKLLWPLVSNRQTLSFVPPLKVLDLLVINGTGFYGPDALSVTQPTVSKHWRKLFFIYHWTEKGTGVGLISNAGSRTQYFK